MRELLAYLGAHRTAMLWVSGLSVAMFVGSLLLMPWLVARAPKDYFVREHEPTEGAAALLRKVLLNLLGVVLLIAGILMLVLPGQGLLMILLALSLLDLPGKRALIHRIVKNDSVWRGLNYLRERGHQPPFDAPD
jgi:archaellum biogenesis protein FlaJ (TadC family)